MRKTPALIGLLVVCIFMGITAISVGLGAAFPVINNVARPFICPDGNLETTHKVYRPYPGKTVTSITYYCAEESSKREISMLPISLIAGSIYGLGLFALVFVIGLLRKK